MGPYWHLVGRFLKEIGSRTNLMKNAEGPFSASRSQIERNLYAKFLLGPFLVGIAFTPSLVGYPQLKVAGCKRERLQKSRSYRSVVSRGEAGLWAFLVPACMPVFCMCVTGRTGHKPGSHRLIKFRTSSANFYTLSFAFDWNLFRVTEYIPRKKNSD